MSAAVIWSDGRPGLADAGDLDRLASLHPFWREDMERLAPWRQGAPGAFGRALWAEKPSGSGARILLTVRCSSAMDVAWALFAESALAPFDAVVAGSQWAGRGQLGRRWVSPPGNLFAAWIIPHAREESFAISLVMGYAALLALRERGLEARIKWPNDVLIGERKAAGILCEQRGPVHVIGIGVNLVSHPPADELREDHATPATSLAAFGVRVSPLRLWERIQEHGRALLASERRAGLAREIEPHLAYLGETIRAMPMGGPPLIARLSHLDDTGALWVEREGRRRRIVSGGIGMAEQAEMVGE